MFMRRLEKLMLFASLSVTALVVVYWRIHNRELATIISEPTDDGDQLIISYPEEEMAVLSNKLPGGVLLWSRPYAGTSDFGNLLANDQKNSLISFEPFAHEQHIHHAPEANTTVHHHRLSLLNDLLHCRYHRHQDLVTSMADRSSFMHQNKFLQSRCQDLKVTCDNGTFVSVVCRESSVHVLKILRLGLKWIRPLLEDEDLDLKVVYLTRDPRALVHLRQKDSRCDTAECKDPEQVCTMLQEDLAEVPFLKQDFPESFRFLRYEELVNSTTLQEILSFTNTTFPINLRQAAESITKYAFHWRSEMEFEQILDIQDLCQSSLRALRYRVFDTEEELRNMTIPVMDASL